MLVDKCVAYDKNCIEQRAHTEKHFKLWLYPIYSLCICFGWHDSSVWKTDKTPIFLCHSKPSPTISVVIRFHATTLRMLNMMGHFTIDKCVQSSMIIIRFTLSHVWCTYHGQAMQVRIWIWVIEYVKDTKKLSYKTHFANVREEERERDSLSL